MVNNPLGNSFSRFVVVPCSHSVTHPQSQKRPELEKRFCVYVAVGILALALAPALLCLPD